MGEQHHPDLTAGGRVRKAAVAGAVVGGVAGAIVAAVVRRAVAGIGIPEMVLTVLYCGLVGAVGGAAVRVLAGKVKRAAYRWAILVVVGVPAAWVCGDLLYGLLMKRGYANWEAGIERDADGIRVGCREYTVGSGDTALLLIHGFADSPSVYQRMAPALAKKGFTCRAVRLPHFAMPMADYRRSTASEWRRAVDAELRAQGETHTKVVVVAHSLGAAVAVDCLADRPEAADGAVLLSPLLGVSDRRSPLLPAETWYHVLDRTLFFTDRVGLFLPPDYRDESASALMKDDRFVPRTIYPELFALLERNRRREGSFVTPLLMVLSQNDEVVDNAAAERFFRDCGAATKQIKYVTEAGHVLPIDHGWEALVEDIAKFSEGLPGRQRRAP